LSNQPIQMDPEKIQGRYDLIVNAGIGTGNRDQHAAHMMQLLTVHQQLTMQGLGPGSEKQMVTMKNIYNSVRDLIVNWGHRNTVDYITDPNDEKADKDPVVEKGPSPDQQLHEREMKKLELEQKKIENDLQIQTLKLQLEAQKLGIEDRKTKTEEWKAGAEVAARNGTNG